MRRAAMSAPWQWGFRRSDGLYPLRQRAPRRRAAWLCRSRGGHAAARHACVVPRRPARMLSRVALDPAPAALPAGHRVYAIGDVHGCAERLFALHGLIAEDLTARPVARP